jgi:hypothetical protein
MRLGETRYVAREITLGPRSTTWGIYDRERASWPVMLSRLGKVPQRFDTEAEAQAWADEHLNDGGVATLLAPPERRPAARKRAS